MVMKSLERFVFSVTDVSSKYINSFSKDAVWDFLGSNPNDAVGFFHVNVSLLRNLRAKDH